MGRAVVVYESMFGNTRIVAEAIAEGASTLIPTELIEVGQAPTSVPADATLVFVGGPTHAFGMTRPSTRADAAKQAEGSTISTERGIREWVDLLEDVPPGTPSATFDTRIDRPRVPGSAAKAAQKHLRRKGLRSVGVESFWVSGTKGPLIPGEVERARAWGARLAASTTEPAADRR